ncbi:MAG: hypothetical protein JWN14_2876 [Chthonomonadales bacterium]|nr:hypothetical protein [Chthonomonadales bacterium]
MPESNLRRIGEPAQRLIAHIDKALSFDTPDSFALPLCLPELPYQPMRDIAEQGVRRKAFPPRRKRPDAFRQVERVETQLLRREHGRCRRDLRLERFHLENVVRTPRSLPQAIDKHATPASRRSVGPMRAMPLPGDLPMLRYWIQRTYKWWYAELS